MELNELLMRPEKPSTKRSKDGGFASIKRRAKFSEVTTVSIVIPAHNEEDYIAQTLDTLGKQDCPGCEIIVVANGCTDNTAAVAHENCDRLVVLPQKGLGVARNVGARVAAGELLIFLDADTILESGALRVIVEKFSQRDGAGTLKGKPDSNRFAYRLIYFLKNSIHRYVNRKGSSGIIICWKKHFMCVGGFDERLEVRENSHLICRLKRFGGYKYIASVAAITSMRRYERCGVWHIVWLWIKLWFQSFFVDLRHRKYETVR